MNVILTNKMATPLNVPESPECFGLLSLRILTRYVVTEPSFPFPAKTAKVSRFPLFLISQGCGQFVVGSGPEFFSNVAECPEIIAPIELLSFQAFEDFKCERECPIQVVDGFVKMSLSAVVKAKALGLRQRGRAFNFGISHVCPPSVGDLVRVRSVLTASGVTRG
jgi:hypothetical protein